LTKLLPGSDGAWQFSSPFWRIPASKTCGTPSSDEIFCTPDFNPPGFVTPPQIILHVFKAASPREVAGETAFLLLLFSLPPQVFVPGRLRVQVFGQGPSTSRWSRLCSTRWLLFLFLEGAPFPRNQVMSPKLTVVCYSQPSVLALVPDGGSDRHPLQNPSRLGVLYGSTSFYTTFFLFPPATLAQGQPPFCLFVSPSSLVQRCCGGQDDRYSPLAAPRRPG